METDSPQSTSADSLVSDALKEHPKVNTHAVQAANRPVPQPPTQEPPKPSGQEPAKDKSGAIFDPKKHYADQFGRPQWTKGGYFKKKSAMRMLKEKSESILNPERAARREAMQSGKLPERENLPPPSNGGPEPAPQSFIPSGPEKTDIPPQPDKRALAHSAADVVVSTIFTFAISRYGVKAKPLKQHEDAMQGAWRRYFEEREITNIPPWAECAIATLSYGQFVHTMSEAAQQEAMGIRGRIIDWIAKAKARAMKRKLARPAKAKEAPGNAS